MRGTNKQQRNDGTDAAAHTLDASHFWQAQMAVLSRGSHISHPSSVCASLHTCLMHVIDKGTTSGDEGAPGRAVTFRENPTASNDIIINKEKSAAGRVHCTSLLLEVFSVFSAVERVMHLS